LGHGGSFQHSADRDRALEAKAAWRVVNRRREPDRPLEEFAQHAAGFAHVVQEQIAPLFQ
jgi:hypothetical protein